MPIIYDGISDLITPLAMSVGDMSPRGITLHYLASRNIETSRQHLIKAGLGYHLIVGRDGLVTQFTYLDQRVNHAGKALWNGKSPNRHHISIALESYGLLEVDDGKLKAFTGREVPATEAALRYGLYWDKATEKQEWSMMSVLKWIVERLDIKPVDVCGHDECCIPPGRKIDPGGVISLSMNDIRDALTHH